ncbi:MAG TPA: hypothetical protein ENI27_07630 [bacterium]|nr:hypothetical protein [bacterium]
MAQRKTDRVKQVIQAEAKERSWEKEVKARRSTVSLTVRIKEDDAELLPGYFRKQGQTVSQGLRAILNNFIDNRIRGMM